MVTAVYVRRQNSQNSLCSLCNFAPKQRTDFCNNIHRGNQLLTWIAQHAALIMIVPSKIDKLLLPTHVVPEINKIKVL